MHFFMSELAVRIETGQQSENVAPFNLGADDCYWIKPEMNMVIQT